MPNMLMGYVIIPWLLAVQLKATNDTPPFVTLEVAVKELC